jgi:hypothetical protein
MPHNYKRKPDGDGEHVSVYIPHMLTQSLMVIVLGVVSNVSVPNFLCLTDVVLVQETILGV